MRKVISKTDNNEIALDVVRSKTLNVTKSDILENKIKLSSEIYHDFFSAIPSKEMLQLIVETIFEIGNKKDYPKYKEWTQTIISFLNTKKLGILKIDLF